MWGQKARAVWQAILSTIHEWEPEIEKAALHAHYADPDVLILSLTAPGRERESAMVDISWIAYSDQAEHLARRTLEALRELDSAVQNQ